MEDTIKNRFGLVPYMTADSLEVGLDECARGCLFGRTYVAAVIWNNDLYGEDAGPGYDMIRDSKKLTKQQREIVKGYIEDNAVDYVVKYAEASEIDADGIHVTIQRLFHECIDELSVEPDHIYVDGICFNRYKTPDGRSIPHKCIPKGDNTLISIAAASILAKVTHDQYIEEICRKNPEYEKYNIQNNMGYGTKEHIDAIQKYGPTKQHRSSFKVKSLMTASLFEA